MQPCRATLSVYYSYYHNNYENIRKSAEKKGIQKLENRLILFPFCFLFEMKNEKNCAWSESSIKFKENKKRKKTS